MKKLVIWFAVLVPACGYDAPEIVADRVLSESSELQGGYSVSAEERGWSGIFELGTPTCTATVISTSAFRRETWLLTAAHCVDDNNTFSLYRGGSLFRSVGFSQYQDFIPAQYDDGPSPNAHDIALIRLSFGINVDVPNGAPVSEFHRPILAAAPFDYFNLPSPFDDQAIGALCGAGLQRESGASCGGGSTQYDGSLRCGLGYFDAQSGERFKCDTLNPSGTYTHGGDSGAPWFVWDPALGSDNEAFLLYGVIAGVHTFHSCVLGDDEFVGASTYGAVNKGFIASTAGDAAVFVNSPVWSRECMSNWCAYRTSERVALIASVTNY